MTAESNAASGKTAPPRKSYPFPKEHPERILNRDLETFGGRAIFVNGGVIAGTGLAVLGSAFMSENENTRNYTPTSTREREQFRLHKIVGRWGFSSLVFFFTGVPVLIWGMASGVKTIFLISVGILMMSAISIRIAIYFNERRREQT